MERYGSDSVKRQFIADSQFLNNFHIGKRKSSSPSSLEKSGLRLDGIGNVDK